jgi:hypothetical protein
MSLNVAIGRSLTVAVRSHREIFQPYHQTASDRSGEESKGDRTPDSPNSINRKSRKSKSEKSVYSKKVAKVNEVI